MQNSAPKIAICLKYAVFCSKMPFEDKMLLLAGA